MTKKKDLVKLQREWYKKLKDDGFEDIEYFDGQMEPRDILYKDGVKAFKVFKDSPGKYESTLDYYCEAGKFYHDHNFDILLDKEIWFLHSEGHPYRAIANELTAPYQYVLKTINKYKVILVDSLKPDQNSTNRSTKI